VKKIDTSNDTINKLFFEQIRELTMKSCKEDRFNFKLCDGCL